MEPKPFATHILILMIFAIVFIIKVDMTYAACVAYMVDVMQSRSSEILAAIKFVISFSSFFYKLLNFGFFLDHVISVMRSVLVAMTVAVILPGIYTYGIAVSYTLCAVLIWVSYRYVIFSENKIKTSWIMT